MSCSFLKNNLRHNFFWPKAILTEMRILNCQVLYLRFSKAITLNCSSFVYYIWKSLFLENILKGLKDRLVLQNTDLWHNITIPPFWEGNLLNTNYWKVFKSTYFEEHLWTANSENVFMKLRKIRIYSLGVLIFSTWAIESVCFTFMIGLPSLYSHTIFIW